MKILLLSLFACCVRGGCLQVETERITTADLAKAVPDFRTLSTVEPVAYAPLPGAQRILGAVELRRIAFKFGLILAQAPDLCFEYPMRNLDPAEVAATLRASFGNPEATIEIVELSKYPVPNGTLSFPKSGLQFSPMTNAQSVLLWRGSLMYGSGKRYAVWARVRIWVESERLVAARDILPGQEITDKDMVFARTRSFPNLAEIPPDSAAILGRTARIRIPAETQVVMSALHAKRAVARGDSVHVVVEGAAMHLAFPAKAESAGALGESVRIVNPATGHRFQAVVDGPRSVSVKIQNNAN